MDNDNDNGLRFVIILIIGTIILGICIGYIVFTDTTVNVVHGDVYMVTHPSCENETNIWPHPTEEGVIWTRVYFHDRDRVTFQNNVDIPLGKVAIYYNTTSGEIIGYIKE